MQNELIGIEGLYIRCKVINKSKSLIEALGWTWSEENLYGKKKMDKG
jgi:hypothetical protein